VIGNLSEHEAAPKDPVEGDTYQPTDDEKRDLKIAEKAFETNKRFKSRYDERWIDFSNMFRGKQWKEQRPSYRHAEVINLIFREIQSSVPIITDMRPKFEFLPQEPSDIEFAEIMNDVAESDWTKYNWSEQLTEGIYDGHKLGTGLYEMGYDPKAENGNGAVVFKSEDPFYHFPSPQAKDVNKDNIAHVKAEPMTLEQIKKRWPNGKYVKSDIMGIKRREEFGPDRVRVQSPTDATVRADGTQQYDSDMSPEALVVTVYLDPDCEIEEKEKQETKDDGSLEVKYVQTRKYPQGKKIVYAGKVVLESGPNEFEDGRFPFARWQNYVNERQFWGIGDIEQLESPQKVFNKLVSFALDVLTLMGNPVWVVGTGSGVDTDNLVNAPGLIIEADDISQVQRQEGVSLQPYVLQLIDRMKLWFDDVSGQGEASRGVQPTGVTAASAIQSLQEATQTRLRQKSRNLDSTLQALGQLYLSRVMQFYTSPRVFRLTNKDGSQKFFKFHIETKQNGAKSVLYTKFEPKNEGGFAEGEIQEFEIKGNLDVRVNTGTLLPFARADKENKALNLFDRGIIDEEEVLKALDYPNWEAVLQRVMEKKALAAQEAAMAQGQPPAA
jgi:hypothetical protein